MRDKMLSDMKSRMESWFDGKHSTYFAQNSAIGSFLGYPQEYDSISHVSDHHCRYGYWIMAAAQIVLRDPAWSSEPKWNGMVNN